MKPSIDLLQAYDEYIKIVNLYENNGTLKNPFFGDVDPRFYYYDWLGDRGAHGLNNTLEQFVGIKDPYFLGRLIRKYPKDFWKYLKDYNGLDQFLTKNWKYWDLVKFIVGYERWNPKVEEMEGIGYIIPGVLRMTGFPTSGLGINPLPLGTIGEWTVGLPPYVVKTMKKHFPNANILIAPGYLFGLYSCGDGLVKERGIDIYHKPIDKGILEVYDTLGYQLIYLMKRD